MFSDHKEIKQTPERGSRNKFFGKKPEGECETFDLVVHANGDQELVPHTAKSVVPF